MRIISKFKDYYDSASSYGIDMECVYVREEKNTVLPQVQVRKANLPQFRGGNQLVMAIIGFCGKLYPVIQHETREHIQTPPFFKVKYHNFYSIEEMKTQLPTDVLNQINNKGGIYHRQNSGTYYSDNWLSIEDFFNNSFNELLPYFVSEHCPTFVYREETDNYSSYNLEITTNISLKNFQFFKVKEPVVAFQEIHMYLSGVLGNKEKETINVTDKVRIQQHGFDKYSFRKLPQEKK